MAKRLSVAAIVCVGGCHAFQYPRLPPRSSALSMVLEKPLATKEISKLETLKIESNYLINPLREVSCGRSFKEL
jgi:hypothetical protein